MKVIDDLMEIMKALRDPETGCPWDLKQSFASIAPHTIEEAYEVADAIAKSDFAELKKELGDLLLHVIFHSEMAREQGYFSFNDVIAELSEKLVKRHPHVFAGASIETADEQDKAWEEQKEHERRERATARGEFPSAIDEIALGLPALLRAHKIQKRVAKVGFDWPDYEMVLDKIDEELEEIEDALEGGESQDRIAEEVGDLLFSVVNLSRKLKINPETALRKANDKFIDRFRIMEKTADEAGNKLENMNLLELDELWESAKAKLNSQ